MSWLRRGEHPDDIMVFVANFTPIPRLSFKLGVPRPGFYKEMLNTDSEMYFGSNIGNWGGLWTEQGEWQHRPHFITMNLPPLAVVAFKPFNE